jgi:hypothetical protein
MLYFSSSFNPVIQTVPRGSVKTKRKESIFHNPNKELPKSKSTYRIGLAEPRLKSKEILQNQCSTNNNPIHCNQIKHQSSNKPQFGSFQHQFPSVHPDTTPTIKTNKPPPPPPPPPKKKKNPPNLVYQMENLKSFPPHTNNDLKSEPNT